jgi:hypothetical protein
MKDYKVSDWIGSMDETEVRAMVADALDKLYWLARSLDHLPAIGRALSKIVTPLEWLVVDEGGDANESERWSVGVPTIGAVMYFGSEGAARYVAEQLNFFEGYLASARRSHYSRSDDHDDRGKDRVRDARVQADAPADAERREQEPHRPARRRDRAPHRR